MIEAPEGGNKAIQGLSGQIPAHVGDDWTETFFNDDVQEQGGAKILLNAYTINDLPHSPAGGLLVLQSRRENFKR